MSTKVVLADDHLVVRQAIKALLEREGECTVIGEATDGCEAVRLARQLQPDAVILEIYLPLMNGLEAAREVRAVSPNSFALLFTREEKDQYISEAFEAGIRGYVFKSQSGSELLQAIREVVRGSFYVNPRISKAVVGACLSKTEPVKDPLTPREHQVLRLAAEGKTSKDIANILGLSARTAQSHRARIMTKLEIRNTPGLVRYAVQQGMIEA